MTLLYIGLALAVYLVIGFGVFVREAMGRDNPDVVTFIIGAPYFLVRSYFKD